MTDDLQYILDESRELPEPRHANASPDILEERIMKNIKAGVCGGKNCFGCGVISCQRDNDALTYRYDQWFKRMRLI